MSSPVTILHHHDEVTRLRTQLRQAEGVLKSHVRDYAKRHRMAVPRVETLCAQLLHT